MEENVVIRLLLLLILFTLIYSKYKTLLFHHKQNLTIENIVPSTSIVETVKHTSESQSFSGIVFFDIDGTLTKVDSKQKESLIEYCLSHNFAVGIMTASSRKPYHLCNIDNHLSLYEWMPSKLCTFLKDTNYITYNSHEICAGMTKHNDRYPIHIHDRNLSNISIELVGTNVLIPGIRKGFQMKYIQHITQFDSAKIILIDNDPLYIFGAKCVFPNGTFVCLGVKECELNDNCHADICTDTISVNLLGHIFHITRK